MAKLFLLFAIMPIVEISLLLHVGEQIGGWNTVAIVILTAFFGAALVRQQGLSTLMEAQRKMQAGSLPGQEMAEGLLLVIAGVLLVTPGFITDIIGFLFSLPMTRPFIAKGLLNHLAGRVIVSGQSSQFHYQYRSPNAEQGGQTIDGEFEKKPDTPFEHLTDNKPKDD